MVNIIFEMLTNSVKKINIMKIMLTILKFRFLSNLLGLAANTI